MKRGYKTPGSGRRAGTPNKRTVELTDKLAALGCDPIEGMARLAMDENNPPELRGRMLAELAGYLYPKRKAIEVTKSTQGDFTLEELLGAYKKAVDGPGSVIQ
jgi:hypothetical protein